jgi:hypothetical protein
MSDHADPVPGPQSSNEEPQAHLTLMPRCAGWDRSSPPGEPPISRPGRHHLERHPCRRGEPTQGRDVVPHSGLDRMPSLAYHLRECCAIQPNPLSAQFRIQDRSDRRKTKERYPASI